MNEDIVSGDVRQGLGKGEGAVGEGLGDLQTRLQGAAQEFTGKAQELYGQAKDQAAETMSSVDAFVSEKPYLSVAIAAAAGAAFGFMLGLGRPKVIVIRPAPRV